MPEKQTSGRNTSDQSNTIGIRLKAEIAKTGISSAELARRSGVLTSFIYDVLRGKSTNPSILKLAMVADCLGVSLTYLIGSELENNPAITRNRNEEKYIPIPHIKLNSSKNIKKGFVSFKGEDEPYLFNAGWIRDNFNVDAASLRIFTIIGDSMEPTICNNDIVLIDTNQTIPSPSGIFIIFDGLGLTAKRLEYVFENDSRNIRIISDNKCYSTYDSSLSDVIIVGRVAWFSRAI
ncbi:MAG: LexA family transcriptional regulator [Rickettsiales bacterium]